MVISHMSLVTPSSDIPKHDCRYLAGQGVRHIELLSRSGRLGGSVLAEGSPLAELLQGGRGWAAAVTITRCDAAVEEEIRAALAGRAKGDGAYEVAISPGSHGVRPRAQQTLDDMDLWPSQQNHTVTCAETCLTPKATR
jgi:hypothetical protein